MVNGNLNNLYSLTDEAFKYLMPMIYKGTKAIGIYPIFEDIKDEDLDKCKKAINYDVTVEAPGHTTYGCNCGQFMYKIKDSF